MRPMPNPAMPTELYERYASRYMHHERRRVLLVSLPRQYFRERREGAGQQLERAGLTISTAATTKPVATLFPGKDSSARRRRADSPTVRWRRDSWLALSLAPFIGLH